MRVSVRTVASYRARHKIAGYTGPRKRQGPGKKMHQSKIDTYASLVGIESDKEIARRAGVTPNAVRHYRMTRGIVPVTQVAAPATSAVSRVASKHSDGLCGLMTRIRLSSASCLVQVSNKWLKMR